MVCAILPLLLLRANNKDLIRHTRAVPHQQSSQTARQPDSPDTPKIRDFDMAVELTFTCTSGDGATGYDAHLLREEGEFAGYFLGISATIK